MLHFRSRGDVLAADVAEEVRAIILDRVDSFLATLALTGGGWEPDSDGFFSLLTVEEISLPLRDLGWNRHIEGLLFEFVHFHPEAGLWEVVYIPGDNWGWTAFFPDSPVIPPGLRTVLEREVTAP